MPQQRSSLCGTMAFTALYVRTENLGLRASWSADTCSSAVTTLQPLGPLKVYSASIEEAGTHL